MQPFIDGEKVRGVKSRTINYPYSVAVRHILNLTSSDWIDDTGKTWLVNVSKNQTLTGQRQEAALPFGLVGADSAFQCATCIFERMALFKVNTGTREAVGLQSTLGFGGSQIPELETSVFIIPVHKVKIRKDDRLVVLNSIAKAVVGKWRGVEIPNLSFRIKGGR